VSVSATAPPVATTIAYLFMRGLDRQTGQERWTSDVTFRTTAQIGLNGIATAASAVVALPGPVAVDGDTGAELWRIEADPPAGTLWPGSSEVVLMGGQDDPLTGLDAATGEVLWTAVGHPYYDNQWAVGSGAVFVTDESDVIAYELSDGSERWRRPLVETSFVSPWAANDHAVYGISPNLVAWSPADGATLWATNYSFDDPDRMSSIAVGDTNVVVTFTTQPMRD
jgi:outer membrane protein assembly factor BamB